MSPNVQSAKKQYRDPRGRKEKEVRLMQVSTVQSVSEKDLAYSNCGNYRTVRS